MSIFERMKSPTPRFFQILRNWGLLLTGVSLSLLSLPAQLPDTVNAIAGYMALAGAVLSGVSQAAVEQE
ncbi:hypothetical protein ACWKWU_13535 [Chitinophaga lutea]